MLAITAHTAVSAAVCAVDSDLPDSDDTDATAGYVVPGQSVADVETPVAGEGGEINHEPGVISAVAAELTARQVEDLRRHRDVRRAYVIDTVEPDGGFSVRTFLIWRVKPGMFPLI